jgi:hypothetical protein
MQVYLGFGDNGFGELLFRESILVPHHGSLGFEIPGQSGRTILVGDDLIQDFQGSEFHNYPFEPNADPNCQLPPFCPQPTSAPSKMPTGSPTNMPTDSLIPPITRILIRN